MFIKIKLEPQNVKALSPLKNISYFSIDDDATILLLKMKIEEYVDVSAERQEIRTLMKTFNNNWKLKDVCEVNGTAIMLYVYDDEYYECQEPQFLCFLQVYTDEMAAQQQEMENLSKLQSRPKVSTPNSSASSATLVAISDTDESEVTDSETASSKSSESDSDGSSSDNSDTSGGKKRSKQGKQSTQHKKLKVTTSTERQFSPTLCQYLDEFPKCSKQTNFENKTVNKTPQATNSTPTEIKPNTTSNSTTNKDSTKIYEDTKKTHSSNINSLYQNTNKTLPEQKSTPNIATTSLSKLQSNTISTTNNNIHPCYAINPEIRENVAVISKNDKNDNDISNNECEELLEWFFDRFRTCDTSSSLKFDYQTAVSLFEGKLWIACMDKNTFEWISASISQYNLKSYTILSLRETSYFCEVVVPIVSNSKNILDIFDLLEKQNKNLSTLKWSIKIRKILLPEDQSFIEKAISTFCTNEIFHISMDKESKDYLEKCNFKLKYCFWQIVFQFV